MSDKPLPFVSHLEELRKRLICCIAAAGAAGILSYFYKEKILTFLIKPVEKVFFLTLPEAFLVYLKISFVSGALLASPYIIYQIWAFTWSAFRPIEKRYIAVYGILSLFLFLGGVAFGCGIGLPAAINFFLSFTKDYLTPIISVNRYINFCLTFIVVFGLLFELPLIIAFITNAGFLTIGQVAAKRKYIIVGIFILAAVFTPPDAASQILVAIPLYILFEASILLATALAIIRQKRIR